jgi:hypothetical protein
MCIFLAYIFCIYLKFNAQTVGIFENFPISNIYLNKKLENFVMEVKPESRDDVNQIRKSKIGLTMKLGAPICQDTTCKFDITSSF